MRSPALLKIVFVLIVTVCWLMVEVGRAQTVQLPSIRQFSYSGSVLVPDRGSASLGGVRSSSTTSSTRGFPGLGRLPGGVSRSSQSSAGGVSVSATIIDLDELDRQILGYDPRQVRRSRQIGAAGLSPEMEIAEAKSLVRNARRAVNAGQRESARSIYALAIEKLRRYDEAGALLAYAQAEVAREFSPIAAADNVASRPRPAGVHEFQRSRRAESSVDNWQVRP